MTTAIVSLTVQGARLAQRARSLWGASVTCYEKRGRTSGGKAIAFDSLSTLMEGLFREADRILCIMSTGIVVRVIAPLLVHKSEDPAILVMDEKALHVISLLSGHLGGANEWCLEVGQDLGADPVITTATDVQGIVAPDVLARRWQWRVEDFTMLVAVNSALVAGTSVPYYVDGSLDKAQCYYEAISAEGLPVDWITEEAISSTKDSLRIVVTDKLWKGDGHTLWLRPPTLVVGIGCRRGTEAGAIVEAIRTTCVAGGRSYLSLCGGASVIVKQDEVGLLEAAAQLRLPMSFYTQEEMAPLIREAALQESEFVKNTIGVGNVCETTAMLLGNSGRVLVPKTVYPRITVALVQANCM